MASIHSLSWVFDHAFHCKLRSFAKICKIKALLDWLSWMHKAVSIPTTKLSSQKETSDQSNQTGWISMHRLSWKHTSCQWQWVRSNTVSCRGNGQSLSRCFWAFFLESVLQHCPDKQVQKKRSPVETKRQRRKITQKNIQHIEKQLQSRDATMILEEGLSRKGYNRICLSESHETPKQKVERVAKHPPKKKYILLPQEISHGILMLL